MSEFEAEVKKAEKELEQGLAPVNNDPFAGKGAGVDEFLGDIKMHAEEYGQKIKDAAGTAYDYAQDKYGIATDKFKELSAKDPKELIEDAKEFARQKPDERNISQPDRRNGRAKHSKTVLRSGFQTVYLIESNSRGL